MEEEPKNTDWIKPKKKHPHYQRQLTYIPSLFKYSKSDCPAFDQNDPFIRPEVLKDHCSILASNTEVLPNYITDCSAIDEVLDFTEDDWKEITQSQLNWENRDKEREEEEKKVKELEEEQERQKEAADTQIKKTLDHKVDKLFNKFYYFIKKPCPVMIPYKSSLNHDEHRAYLRAFVKFKIRAPKTAAEVAEYDNFLRLQNRVYEEQQMFMKFSYQVAQLQSSAYNEVPDVINSFIDNYVQVQGKRVFSYNCNYVQEQSVPICPLDPSNRFSDLYFNHIGHLLSLGSIPHLKLPSSYFLNRLPLDETVKEKTVKEQPDVNGKYFGKIPVSQDPNAVYLAKNHEANIVISTSALKVITDNPGPNFEKDWDIPVKVCSYNIKDSNGKEKQHRVVFIDKPLPKKIWSPSEKKQRFYKKSALASLREIKRKNYYRMRCPLIFKIEKVDKDIIHKTEEKFAATDLYEEDLFDIYADTAPDVFGSSSSMWTSFNEENDTSSKKNVEGSEKSPKKRKIKNKGSVTCDVDNENSSLTNDDSMDEKSQGETCGATDDSKELFGSEKAETQKQIEGTHESEKDKGDKNNKKEECTSEKGEGTPVDNPKNSNASPKTSSSKDSSAVLDNLMDMVDSLLKPDCSTHDSTTQNTNARPRKLWPWSDTLETNWDEHPDPKNFKNFSGENVHYQLFQMGFNNSLPHNTTQPLRILVRSSIHGFSFHEKRKGNSKPYIIYAKPEYQVYFGCEVNTLSEITHQWIDLLIRPHTALLEVRVCQFTGDIMMSEEKTLASVLKEGKQQHISFSPQQPMSTMYSVFNAVSALATGDYLLHHDIKTEAFIKLMKSTESEKDAGLQTFNLHDAYFPTFVYTRTHSKPPWIALDTHKLTAFHMKHYKIPGTFPMENPNKKLSKREKKLIKEKAAKKKKLDDLKETQDNDENIY